jgi:hypothetical protein
MAGRVGDDELAPLGVEIAVRDVDGDALLALGFKAVGEEGEIDPFPAATFVIALRSRHLIFKRSARVDKETTDQGGLPVVDAARSNEPKKTDAQKYPSRFLSSIVFAP